MFRGLPDLIVYLVEPSAVQSRMIVAALNAVGVRNIHRYASAAEALQRMREAQPNVVISALYLPDMSGTDLIQTLRRDAEFEHVPFILISSETRPQVLEPVRQSGVCGILPKPFTEDQLRRALRSTLELLDDGDSDDSSGIDFERLRVLLVDDSAMARGYIRRVLETLGIEHFIEAENGAKAVLALADAMVDLVVTDYNMPEMDGKALIDHIRQKSWQTTVPILMVTSESDRGRLAAVEEAGVSGICDKPFEPGMVKTLLRNVLRPELD